MNRSDFAWALEQAQCYGAKITRAGWNATNQWVVMQRGYPQGIGINRNTAEATGLEEGTVCRFSPYLMLKNAHNEFVPWVPSQGDLFAKDWSIVE